VNTPPHRITGKRASASACQLRRRDPATPSSFAAVLGLGFAPAIGKEILQEGKWKTNKIYRQFYRQLVCHQ